jgi:hypothetical protein
MTGQGNTNTTSAIQGNDKTRATSPSTKKHPWNKTSGKSAGPTVKSQTSKSHFKGALAALNGHVFEVHNEASKANQYQKTTQAIAAYANRTMKYGKDMRYIIENLKDVDFKSLVPKEPTTASGKVAELMLQQQVSIFMKRQDQYDNNKDSLYTIIWNQCSEALQAKLEGTPEYGTYAPLSCPIGLLKHIKQVSLKFENVTYKPAAVQDAQVALFSFYQTKQDSLHQYYLKFKDLVDALDHYGAEVGINLSLVRHAAEMAGEKSADQIDYKDQAYKTYLPAAKERFLALRFLRGADRSKYNDLVVELDNDYAKGTDHYPATVAAAYTLLSRRKIAKHGGHNGGGGGRDKSDKSSRNGSGAPEDEEVHGIVFVNKDGKPVRKEVVCYDCGGNHYRGDSECPNHQSKITDGADYLRASRSLSVAFVGAHPHNIINKNWILLDNQSSVHIFKSKDMVTDITHVPATQGLIIHSNGGSQFTNKVANHPDIGKVWFNPNAITNIISFSQCRHANMHLRYDHQNDYFQLRTHNNKVFYFKHMTRVGLYACDMSQPEAFCATITVEAQQRMFTPRQIADADRARSLQRMLGRPSDRTLKHMLRHNLIRNTTVTADDVVRANKIYGPELGCLKGKTVRGAPTPVRLPAMLPLPDEIRTHHQNIVLCLDVCHVDGLRFLASISRHLHFGTIEFVSSLEHSTLSTAVQRIINVYTTRGFTITWILTDRAFEHLRPVLERLNVHLNTTSANEHVPEVERFIRVIKERVRGFVTTYPVSNLPNVMKIHLLQHTVQMLNLTIQPNGVSDILSPAGIVLGSQLDAHIHCRLEFGSYCQIHEEPSPSNDVNLPRTIDAIALRPLGNAQGGYYFLCLSSWRILARRAWTQLPMPSHIVELLNSKAIEEASSRAQYIRNDHFHFRRLDRSTITSLDDDDHHLLFYPFVDEGARAVIPLNDDIGDHNANDDPVSDHDVNDSDVDLTTDDDNDCDDNDHTTDDTPNDDASDLHAAEPHDDELDDDTPDDNAPDHDEPDDDDDNAPAITDSQPDPPSDPERPAHDIPSDELLHYLDNTPADSLQAVIRRTMPQRDPHAKNSVLPDISPANILPPDPDMRPSTQRYSMRRQVAPRFEKGFNMAIACTQMTAREGLKRFGKDAEIALMREWQQLDKLEVYYGVFASSLTPLERRRALRLVQLIKLKKNGTLKGRTCADGRKQRAYIPADDASSPTVSNEALLLTCVTDAREHRKVVTADVPGAFLHAHIDDIVHVIVEGEQMEILIKSNPEYAQYVSRDPRTGKDRLFLRLNKALYGTLKAARLFYEDLTKHLRAYGFTANPYDPCVMNKKIRGSQCTIAWHVDDIKISHKKQSVLEEVLDYLQGIYGELSITRGTRHTFVGMDLEFGNGKVEISMDSYLREAIEAFPEEIKDKVASPAADHLYTVNENGKRLPEDRRECFHHIVAKLLFVATRARPDLQLTISFLTSRCSKADEDDWKKLKRLLCYIKGTIDLKLTLRANATDVVMWWADAAFAVRDDFKSQSGRGMSLGTGMIQCKSHKQSTTENSSTTAELVSSSDALIMIIWTNNFLKAQGYPIKDTILFQDNMSAIKLEKNGRQSSSKRTRHLNIKHFFIKDRVDAGELRIEHCGTDDMVADYFTKPLQGEKFRQFRDLILGIKDFDATDQIRSVLKLDLESANLNQNTGHNDSVIGDTNGYNKNKCRNQVRFQDEIGSS